MSTIEPENNLPEIGEIQNRTLSFEEQFMMTNFIRSIEKCGDMEQVKKVTTQLIQYYFHSQSLIKSLMLDKLNMDMPKEERIDSIVRAKEMMRKAQEEDETEKQ